MKFDRARKILFRGLMLRCPDCGEAGIYQAPLQVKHHCTHCGLVFQREQGYFTGALYINLLVAEFSVLLTFVICLLVGVENTDRMFAILLAMGVLMPLLFFHHSRSLWLCFDHFIDPIKNRVKPPSEGFGLKL
jgi:uncharacterized protein (DUF983 family)